MTPRTIIGIAALLLAAAVGMGAFGAHGLKEKLDAYSMQIFEKAVFYHFIHALGVLILPALPLLTAEQITKVALALIFGTLVFSGSLYVLALTGIRWLGAITPIGGIGFIVGWLLLARHSFFE